MNVVIEPRLGRFIEDDDDAVFSLCKGGNGGEGSDNVLDAWLGVRYLSDETDDSVPDRIVGEGGGWAVTSPVAIEVAVVVVAASTATFDI